MRYKKIKPPENRDSTMFLRKLFLHTEQELVHEITRKRKAGFVDYAEAASLERVQRILQNMVDDSWKYVPEMIENIFYHSEKDFSGYRNARALTTTQTAIVQQLSNNLLGEIMEASETAYKSVQTFYAVGRLESDPFRQVALKQVLNQQASGSGWATSSAKMVQEIQNKGIPAFVDKSGRRWSLQSYGNMAVRTTARQAEVSAMLTMDDHDLWQIVKIGSTCPVCAALEGRVYSKSGTNSDYPPLSLAFGKVDPEGTDELTNTYLNIHPNCLHSLVKYTTIGKTEKQIQKDKDFSNPDLNPLDRDPRTKKQIQAYRKKERQRQRLLRDKRQHKEYRDLLGDDIPKDFAMFQKLKYNDPEKFGFVRLDYQRRNDLIRHPELRLPNAENVILPEGKFAKYLFDGMNQKGLAKGRAITSRLGYDKGNWREFQKEIRGKAGAYPVIPKDRDQYGQRYEQKIIIYGKYGTPANVVIGWNQRPDGSVSLSSAYIKEVK